MLRKKNKFVEFQKISGFLNRVLIQVTGSSLDQLKKNTEILETWEKIMGTPTCLHARPSQLKRGVLTVNVDSNVWLYELSTLSKESFLKTLQNQFPQIKKVRFQIGPVLEG